MWANVTNDGNPPRVRVCIRRYQEQKTYLATEGCSEFSGPDLSRKMKIPGRGGTPPPP